MRSAKLSSSQRLGKHTSLLIGLTGGIATGKSAVTKILREQGQIVFCADELVKEIYQAPETYEFIFQHFPQAVADKKILFPVLRKLFFNDIHIQSTIEAYIYPKLDSLFTAKIAQTHSACVFFDVPLLFEKKMNRGCDYTVLVYAHREIQKSRLMQRDHIEEALAEEILKKQMPIDEKKNLADWIIENEKSMEDLHNATLSMLTHFLKC